jgi:hypothetical protein
LNQALLCLFLCNDLSLRIDLKCESATGMTHELLNHLYVLSVRD